MPLLIQISATAALDQVGSSTPWLYYGIVASGIPNTVPGCSNEIGTGSIAGRPGTFAHELGHMFGLPHAPCGNSGPANDDYPNYAPYGPASIGEYGLDIGDDAATVVSPAVAHDIMAYCGPRWISVYTYEHLTGISDLSPVIGPVGAGGSAEMVAGAPHEDREVEPWFERSETVLQPLIHMLGVIEPDGSITVSSVARLETRFLRGRGRKTGHVAQLLDDAGRVLATGDVFGYPARGCGCGCGGDGEGVSGGERGDSGGDGSQPLMFKAMVDDVAPGASLRILEGDEVVWERRGADEPPTVVSFSAALETQGDLKLSWQVDGAPEDDTEVWVRWSNDDGHTWHALTVGQRGTSAIIDPAQIPAGDVRFQLLAHDGFHTVTSVSEPLQLPAKPPAVTIFQPGSATRHDGHRQIHLFGMAASHGRGEVDPQAAMWYLDGQPVATGFDAWVDSPSTGGHEIRLEATHEGQVGAATVQISAIPGRLPERG